MSENILEEAVIDSFEILSHSTFVINFYILTKMCDSAVNAVSLNDVSATNMMLCNLRSQYSFLTKEDHIMFQDF
jgi:hypothetical protein